MENVKDESLYRLSCGIVIMNHSKEILTCQRDVSLTAPSISYSWQMPGGAVQQNDLDYYSALTRELKEETGIEENQIELITSIPYPLYYDLPQPLQSQIWQGKYLGQKQYWYLAKLIDRINNINHNNVLDKKYINFKWTTEEKIIEEALFFKKTLYKKVFDFFNEYKSETKIANTVNIK